MQTHAKSFLDCPHVAAWLSNPTSTTTTTPSAASNINTNSNANSNLFRHIRGVNIQACPPPPISYVRTPPKAPKKHLFVPVDVCDAHGHVLGYDTGNHNLILPGATAPIGNGNNNIVSKFALDGGRKTAMTFQHKRGNKTVPNKNNGHAGVANTVNTATGDGNIVVSIESFDEIGDGVVEVRHFRAPPTAIPALSKNKKTPSSSPQQASSSTVGMKSHAAVPVVPEIMATSKIFHKRDCQECAAADRPCACKNDERLRRLLQLNKKNKAELKTGNDNDIDKTAKTDRILYPAWKFIFDAYVDAHLGNYIIQVQHISTTTTKSAGGKNQNGKDKDWVHCDFHLAYRTIYRRMGAIEAREAIRELFFNNAKKTPSKPASPCDNCTISVTIDNRVEKSSHITHCVLPPAHSDTTQSNVTKLIPQQALICKLPDLNNIKKKTATNSNSNADDEDASNDTRPKTNTKRPRCPTLRINQVVACCCAKTLNEQERKDFKKKTSYSKSAIPQIYKDNSDIDIDDGHCEPCHTNTILPSSACEKATPAEETDTEIPCDDTDGRKAQAQNGPCAPTFQFLELEDYSIAAPIPGPPLKRPRRTPSVRAAESEGCTSLLCSDHKCCPEIPYEQPAEWALRNRAAVSDVVACNGNSNRINSNCNRANSNARPQDSPSPCMCTPASESIGECESTDEPSNEIQDTITGHVQVAGDIHNTVRESNINYISRCQL